MWRQGEHVALIGRTGTGKTTLLESLCNRRKYVIMLATKSDTLAWRKWTRSASADAMYGAKVATDGSVRIRLQPTPGQRESEFRTAIKRAYQQRGWTVAFDELYEMQQLGLEPEIIQLYSEGRSEFVTCIGGMQRPSWVTRKGVSRWALSQPTHLFGFQVDETDAKTLRDVVDPEFAYAIRQLRAHEFIYRNQVSREQRTGSVRSLAEVI